MSKAARMTSCVLQATCRGCCATAPVALAVAAAAAAAMVALLDKKRTETGKGKCHLAYDTMSCALIPFCMGFRVDLSLI